MKMAVFLSVFLTIAFTAGYTNGQSGIKETRDLSGFTKVSFGAPGELYINFGKEFKVVLEGEKSFLEDIKTEVTNGKLVIKRENRSFSWNGKVTVYITMPELAGLSVSGSGRAEIKDPSKSEDLSLSVSGSGKINTTDITTSSINCSISGSGDIVIGGNGSATKADIAISGSGNYSGEPLKIGSAQISISGSGNCTCNVTESLRGSVSGSGNVNYTGNPKIDARVSGSGHIRSK